VRCDYLLVDDPVQITDSGNSFYLATVNGRFDTDLVSRLNNPRTGTIVVVHHRLNQTDLTGYLQNRRSWVHRALSLVASEDCDFQLRDGVWRRKRGDVLRPDAYTRDYIAELRENTGPPGFAPLYQQCFDGADVIQISRDDFVPFSVFARPAVPYVLSIDPNHKGQVGQSYSVIQCWALLADGKYLLYDQWRGRAHNAVFCSLVQSTKAKYRPRVILVEDNGPALELQERFETARCPVILINPSGNKLSRLRRHLDLFRAGRVLVRTGLPCMEELMTEFETFPYGDDDDQVDAATQFFDWIELNDIPAHAAPQRYMGAISRGRQARAALYCNAGRPTRYVFSRR
jgi:predicted phage terminase large subunit-like protein